MKITIQCTAAEQIEFKRNLKSTDTKIIYTQQINKPDNMTCGEYALSKIKWEVNH